MPIVNLYYCLYLLYTHRRILAEQQAVGVA